MCGEERGPNPAGQADGRAGSGHPRRWQGAGRLLARPQAGRQAGREQAGQEHSGLLATQAEAAAVVVAAAGPEQGAGRRCSGGVGGARGRPRPMSASRPW